MSSLPGLSSIWAYLQTVDLNQARSQIVSWVTTAPAAAGQPAVPAFSNETADNIEKWAPTVFAGFTTLYCLFRHTPAFLAGLSLAIYQERHPGHFVNVLESFAKTNLPYQNKKFGLLSAILDNHLAPVSVAALAAMWAPNVAQSCVPIYFTYVAATEFLSPVPEQKPPAPEKK